jgi:P-type E1-E2 ATPase
MSAVAMERLGETVTAALDKTGTLTEGAREVSAVTPRPDAGLDADALLALAAAAEHPREHPLARAIVAAARAQGLPIAPADDFTATPGRGVSALVDGHRVTVGRDESATEDGTVVLVARDGEPLGTLTLTDRLRPDAPATTAALTALTGTAPVLLTGDHAGAAARVAGATGLTDVRAGLLPEDKANAVRDLQRAGRTVLFVGDGVNDAPALAAAHSGIAMGRAGSDLALETADAVVVRDELAAVPAVVRLSRAARRLVVQNLVIAGAFITGLVLWDLIGHLPLPLGVAGHEGSTVLVGLNGLRLLRRSAWRQSAG